ncbi:MAG: hypothetical protein K0S33_1999 [Bacteroidetes bacterium]|jgi:hypothetical protein|nr:hypothetical protein [Bacteroidota bacterium]
MIRFKATLEQFREKGEKTGWTYIEIPQELAHRIKPDTKKAFRVKGKLDKYEYSAVSLVPMGEGDFIMAVNAEMRKAIKKQKGDEVVVQMEEDKAPRKISSDLITCLKEDKAAEKYFNSLAPSHQKYYSNWIESAKTPETKAKRIAQTLEACSKQMHYGEMMRANKGK